MTSSFSKSGSVVFPRRVGTKTTRGAGDSGGVESGGGVPSEGEKHMLNSRGLDVKVRDMVRGCRGSIWGVGSGEKY
jgi:hypothetical protein